MRVNKETRAAILSSDEYKKLEIHLSPLRQFMEVLQQASSEQSLPEGLRGVWEEFTSFEKTLDFPGALRLRQIRKTRDPESGDVTVPGEEFVKFASHIKAVGQLLRRVDAAADANELPEPVSTGWSDLKGFLGSQTLAAASTTTTGGEEDVFGVFCCMVYSDDEHEINQEVLDCIEYQEWQLVAMTLCATAALTTPGATGSQLTEGPCDDEECPKEPNGPGGW